MSKSRAVSVTVSSDYASLGAGGRSFYFGYEFGNEPDPDEEGEEREVWGFEYRDEDGPCIRMAYEDLARYPGCPDRFECVDCLLFGIGVALLSGQVR